MLKRSAEMIGYERGLSIGNNVFSFLMKHQKTRPQEKIFQWVDAGDLAQWKKDAVFKSDLPHQSITFGEFVPLVQRTAAGYLDLGIEKNQRAIVFLPMGVELYAAMFALQMIGAIPVFLDSWARCGQLGSTAKVVDPVAMISVAPAFAMTTDLEEFKTIKWRIVHQSVKPDANFVWLNELIQFDRLADPVPLEQEQTALVTFTTGSSGVPKGANRSHRFLAAQHYAINKNLPYESVDVDLPVFPIFSLNNIAAGVRTVIPAIDVGTQNPTDAPLLLSQIFSCQATCATLSPSLLNSLVSFCAAHSLSLPLRRVAAGGAPISRDNVVAFCHVAPHAMLDILYGSTEVEPISHIDHTSIIKMLDHVDNDIVEIGVPVGKIADGLKYKIIKIQKGPVQINSEPDWLNQEVPADSPGELIVAGEHVCGSYFNNEKAFETSKILDHSNTVWHRTGDIALFKEGCMWIVGRTHNSFVRKNVTLFPVRAEIVLKRVVGVKSAAYLGVPADSASSLRATVVVTLQPDIQIDPKVVLNEIERLFLKNDIAFDDVYILEKLPLDPRHHSKIEYDILRAEILANRSAGLVSDGG
jgi:olefin beta-lactone synthetase